MIFVLIESAAAPTAAAVNYGMRMGTCSTAYPAVRDLAKSFQIILNNYYQNLNTLCLIVFFKLL